MADKTDPAVDAAVVRPTTEVVNPAGTPAPVAVDAAAKGAPAVKADAAIDWKAEAEKYKSEAKTAFGERDRAKQELAVVAGKATKFDETVLAQQKAAEDALKEQGKFKELYEAAEARATSLEARIVTAAEESAKVTKGRERQAARAALTGAYEKLKGIDRETFEVLTDKEIDEGRVSLGPNGSLVGGAEVLTKLAESKPWMFGSAKEALEQVKSLSQAGAGDGDKALGDRKKSLDQPPARSLAEMGTGGYQPPPHWRNLGKT